MKGYTVYHLHDDTSNCNGYADSCSKYYEYIALAKEQGMTAIAFSNHGGIYDWIKKKQDCDKAGIKYIHGIEHYLCTELQADERGCHIGLYAKNWEGVLELNSLYSISTDKDIHNPNSEDKSNRHVYYNPRISLDELMSTSDNIIVTTACIQSPLNKWFNSEQKEYFTKLVKWLTKNKHRCFLEIQYHNVDSQKEFNKRLYNLSKKTGIPLIAGTDTHSSSQYKAECRVILQKYKDSFYGEEDSFDLSWKTYDELVNAFKIQNALPRSVYLEAIENTNVFADMIDEFDLDRAFKYPDLYGDNARELWKDLIYNEFKQKAQNKELKLPSKIKKECEIYFKNNSNNSNDERELEIYKEYRKDYEWAKTHTDKEILTLYKNRITEEYKVMCNLGMESFMLFMSELITWANNNGIPCGTGRGSVCGSMIAYITNITDVDPIVWNTVFSRFCNADRVSLGDIDVDFAGEDREKVYQYIIDRFTPQKTSYIAAFTTLKERGCIDALAGGLGYKDLNKVMEIKDKFKGYFDEYSKIVNQHLDLDELFENGEIESQAISFDYCDIYIKFIADDKIRNQMINCRNLYNKLISDNKDIFYYLDGLKDTIVAKGNHPSGIIGSPITLADNIGVFYKDGDSQMPVSTCAMKAVDSLNYVKFDILGLKTVGIIKDACKYAGIPYPKSGQINWKDIKVWKNMTENQQGVFQFEGDYAFKLLKDFKPTTINHMSMVNAALRPSGKSYRDKLIAGEKNRNPSKDIDDLLSSNNGYLIFQEDTIKFLTDICGFTGSAADTTRRAIGKKDKELLKQQLPKILDGYCNHSSQPREIAEQEAKQFVQIIQDSSDYQFGFNHSTAYSMNGYECVYLRTYYPLEFLAAYLNRGKNKKDTVYGVALARDYNIEIKPIRFGKSLGKYTINKKENCIYKGIGSVKECNEQIAYELLDLSESKEYTNFIDLISDINTKTSVRTNQLKILTMLNFFEKFGKNAYLLKIIDLCLGVKKNGKTIIPSFKKCKQISKSKIESYSDYGVSEFLLKKYSRETKSQYKDIDNEGLLKELLTKIPNKSMGIQDYIKAEIKYLEYTTYKNSNIPDRYYIVVSYKTFKDDTKPTITIRNLNTGIEIITKIKQSYIYKANPFGLYSILEIHKLTDYNKSKLIDGKWTKTEETEQILAEYEVIKR